MNIAQSITLNDFELARFFFAIVLLLVLAHGCGYLFHHFKLPKVIGEIMGGFLLGPSILGFVWPTAHQWVFQAFPSEGKLISIISWFGLVFLMFVSGFEIQKSIDRHDRRLVVSLFLGSTILPFAVGWAAPEFYDFSSYLGVKNNFLALKIVIGIAAAVTSIPVISRIFIDLGVMNTKFAKIVLATATIHDVILWVALALATGLVGAGSVQAGNIVYTVLITFLFFLAALFVMPKITQLTSRSRMNVLIKSSLSGYVLLICFFFVALASILNVNIVFGAFLAGIVVGTLPHDPFGSVKIHIKEISLGFFIPIYFAVVGLKLDLVRHFDLFFFAGFLLLGTFIEIVGTMSAAKLLKEDWLGSFNLGVAMSTRGGPGIVLATVAFDTGIINETFFVVLVMAAIMTSLLAGLWFRWVLAKGWKLL